MRAIVSGESVATSMRSTAHSSTYVWGVASPVRIANCGVSDALGSGVIALPEYSI